MGETHHGTLSEEWAEGALSKVALRDAEFGQGRELSEGSGGVEVDLRLALEAGASAEAAVRRDA